MILLGYTSTGQPVLGGAFQMADTHGFPLWAFIGEARKHGCVTSFAHYFASAVEAGWDDVRAFAHIREAMVDSGDASAYEQIIERCRALMATATGTATERGRAIRERLTKGQPEAVAARMP